MSYILFILLSSILIYIYIYFLGILSMKVGERSRLTIKSDYGYGDSGAGGVIPPKATLIFDVEVLEMNEPEETKSLIRIILFSILIFFFYYFYFKK